MGIDQLDFLIEQLSDPVVAVDRQLIIVSYNKAAEACFQYTKEEVIGKHLNMLMPDNFHTNHNQLAEKYMKDNEPPRSMNNRKTLIYAKRKDGYEFLIKVAISNWHMSGQQYALAIINSFESIAKK